MFLTDQIGLLVLILTLGAQVFLRSFWYRHLRKAFPAAVLAVFGILAFWAVLQYWTWASNPLSKYLLPPHEDIGYFYGYVAKRFFAPWLISLAAAILASGIAEYLNRRLGERFFEKEELPLFALGIFLSGYPRFLFYIVLLLFAELLLATYYSLRSKGRAPLYYLWLPLAIFAILITNWLIPREFTALFGL